MMLPIPKKFQTTPTYRTFQQLIGNPVVDDFSRFNLGGVPIPRGIEPRHFIIIGSTGGGKSVALKTVLDQADKANQRAIVMDNSADFANRYYNEARGDVILNPYDKRCVNWSPLAEIRHEPDARAMAASICPLAEGADKTWTQAGQNFIYSILLKLLYEQNPTTGDFLHWVVSATPEELREFLAGTEARPYVEEGNERYFGSVRSTALERVSIFAALPQDAGRDNGFSIRDWVAEDGKSWLFCTYTADQLNSLRYLISTVIDTVATSALSLSQSETRRLFIAIDEWPAIGKINSIGEILAQGRKFGACLLAATQSRAAIEVKYGDKDTSALFANFNTWLMMRVQEESAAILCSGVCGKGDYERRTLSISHGQGGASGNFGVQVERDVPAVTPSEFQNLPAADAETMTPPVGYLKIAGSIPVCRVTLSFPPKRPDRIGYIAHPNLKDRRNRVEGLMKAAAKIRAGESARLETLLGEPSANEVSQSLEQSQPSVIIVPEPSKKKASSHAPSAPSPQKAPNILAQAEETSTSSDVLGAAESGSVVNAAAADDTPNPLAALDTLDSPMSSLLDD